jgi:hypothetical protein
LGNAGLARELHEQIVLVGIEIDGVQLAFRFAHTYTLATLADVFNTGGTIERRSLPEFEGTGDP